MKYIKIFRIIAAVLIVIILLFLIWYTRKNEDEDEYNNKLVNYRKRNLAKSAKNNYMSQLELYLTQNGISYMFPGITPEVFILIKILLMLLIIVISISFQNIYIGMFSIIGYFIPNIVFKLSNEEDNKKMLPDIKNIYDMLKIQKTAGVYITNTLAECYVVCKNKRLKSAMLELTNKINAKADIGEAIDSISIKFNNNYIDMFCIIIKQMLETGQTAQLLDDMSSQLVDVENIINRTKETQLQRKVQMIQLLIYAGILIITMFALFSGTNLIEDLM